MSVTSIMGQTTIFKLYMTGKCVRTHNLPVGRYQALLGLCISLIDVQGSLRTAIPFIYAIITKWPCPRIKYTPNLF